MPNYWDYYLHVVSIGWFAERRHVAVFNNEADAKAFAATREELIYTGTIESAQLVPGFIIAETAHA